MVNRDIMKEIRAPVRRTRYDNEEIRGFGRKTVGYSGRFRPKTCGEKFEHNEYCYVGARRGKARGKS